MYLFNLIAINNKKPLTISVSGFLFGDSFEECLKSDTLMAIAVIA